MQPRDGLSAQRGNVIDVVWRAGRIAPCLGECVNSKDLVSFRITKPCWGSASHRSPSFCRFGKVFVWVCPAPGFVLFRVILLAVASFSGVLLGLSMAVVIAFAILTHALLALVRQAVFGLRIFCKHREQFALAALGTILDIHLMPLSSCWLEAPVRLQPAGVSSF